MQLRAQTCDVHSLKESAKRLTTSMDFVYRPANVQVVRNLKPLRIVHRSDHARSDK